MLPFWLQIWGLYTPVSSPVMPGQRDYPKQPTQPNNSAFLFPRTSDSLCEAVKQNFDSISMGLIGRTGPLLKKRIFGNDHFGVFFCKFTAFVFRRVYPVQILLTIYS